MSILDDSPVGRTATPSWLLERYADLERMHSDGELETWRAVARDGRRVLVRFAPHLALSPGARLRFDHHRRALAGLESASLSPTAGDDAGDACVESAQIGDARPLAALLDGGAMEVPRAIRLATDLLEGLAALHDVGLIHRDVCPSLLMIGERARLIPFGLTRYDLRRPPMSGPQWRYAAPEQCGLLHRDVGTAADLHAVGVVLYECLAGSHPFPADDLRTLLRLQAAGAIPPLPRHVPQQVGRIVERLLQTDPRQRYQRARAVLADLSRARDDASASFFVLGQFDARDDLSDPQFIGRDAELQALEAFLGSRDLHPQLAFVEAPSGGGKSRLLDEFGMRARQSGAVLMSARGIRAEAQAPFHMLTQVLQGVMAEAELDASIQGRVQEVIADNPDTIWILLPGHGTREEPRLPDVSGEFRILAVARKLLECVGSAARPLLLLLDDCQWADRSTLRLLQHWLGQETSTVRAVAAFRSEEVGPGDALRDLSCSLHIVLPPFTDEQTWALALSMGGTLPEAALRLMRQADGNPFRATELLRGAQESGRLRRVDGRWRLTAEATQYSDRAAILLVDRLGLLPPGTRRTLEAAAVLGRTFDVGVVAHLIEGDVVDALREAQARALIWRDPRGERCTFVHDRVRETLLGSLGDADRRALHASAARYFAQHAADAVYERAYHLQCAGDVAAAFPHALAAADDARQRFALEDAEQHYRIALLGAPDARGVARVREGLTYVLLMRAQYTETERLCLQALEETTDALSRARYHGYLAEMYYKTGKARETYHHAFEALRLVGHRTPANRTALWLDIGRQLVVQALHSWFPRRYLARRPLTAASGDLLAIQLYDSLKQASASFVDMTSLIWAHLCSLNAIERYPPTPALGWVWTEHGEVLLIVLHWKSRGTRYMDRGIDLSMELGERLFHARGLNRKACATHYEGRLRDSLAVGTRCLAEFADCVEDSWEIGAAQFFRARNLFLMGQTRAATKLIHQVWASQGASGDPRVAYAALGDWARHLGGRIAVDELRDPASALLSLPQAELLMARGFHQLGCGDPAEGARLFAASSALTGGQEPREFYVYRLCWQATAWRLAASALSVGTGRRRAEFLRNARRAARAAMSAASKTPVRLPHALRERALLAAEAGRTLSARKLFAASLRIAVEHENMYDFAWTLYERGRTGRALGWSDADQNLADARWAFRCIGLDSTPLDVHRIPAPLEEERPPSPGLMDRFLAVIDAGRAIVKCLTVESVLEAVRQAAVDLLRPRSCRIEAPPRVYAGDARSWLDMPLTVGGRAVASFVVTHDVSDYFQAEEQMLAAYIAALGSAALETAESFAAIEGLSASLRRQSEQLQGALDEKEVMLREIHHRVKNNLQVILSLLNLQASQCADPALEAEFADMTNRIRSMAVIHEFIHGEENLSEIRMDGYLETLVKHLVIGQGTSRVHTVCAFAPVVLPIATAVDCGLMVNELVSNALQHAFPGERTGNLEVTLARHADRLLLSVADDGVGFDCGSFETAASMGLTLVRLLRDKLGASVTYEGRCGTLVQVQLPGAVRP